MILNTVPKNIVEILSHLYDEDESLLLYFSAIGMERVMSDALNNPRWWSERETNVISDARNKLMELFDGAGYRSKKPALCDMMRCFEKISLSLAQRRLFTRINIEAEKEAEILLKINGIKQGK